MKLKITVDGKIYEVDVEVAEPEAQRATYVPPPAGSRAGSNAPVASPVPTAGTGAAAHEPNVDERKACRSPISGVVVRIHTQVGQAIQVNDVLMVLEAMKMETSISSPVAGKVAKIHVGVGDSVRGGQLLVEFE